MLGTDGYNICKLWAVLLLLRCCTLIFTSQPMCRLQCKFSAWTEKTFFVCSISHRNKQTNKPNQTKNKNEKKSNERIAFKLAFILSENQRQTTTTNTKGKILIFFTSFYSLVCAYVFFFLFCFSVIYAHYLIDKTTNQYIQFETFNF